ncbi:MAG: outer membrane beta-barrel family protein [Bacteroidales bacterium]
MKRFYMLTEERIAKVILAAFSVMIFGTGVYAQDGRVLKGKLIDERSRQAVQYAYVLLYAAEGGKFVQGTLSDVDGRFRISRIQAGNYRLLINFLGYKPAEKVVTILNDTTDAGEICLRDSAILTAAATVVAERPKAKAESNKTTFYITGNMADISGTGFDVLKHIPGIQVDLMQNISLEGSRDILIFVNGIERDRGFVKQLLPSQIDKVEIISVPASNYDGNITGAINIILKKERNTGLSGQVFSEIPLTGSMKYVSPSYSLNFSTKKLNLYTSYNGQLTYLDLHESMYRRIYSGTDTNVFASDQYVRQKDWTHRFNYGFDYYVSPKDIINFYGYINPFSRELDGTAGLQVTGSMKESWNARKEDTDINTGIFYSLYYKHMFEKPGAELTFDLSNYNLKARNSTEFIYDGPDTGKNSLINSSMPWQKIVSAKSDYSTPIGKKLIISTGVKTVFQFLKDKSLDDFNYRESVLAWYGMFNLKEKRSEINLGIRTEKSWSGITGSFNNSIISVLPNAKFRYKLKSNMNLQLSYNRSVRRPNRYQLDPYLVYNDPYSLTGGNPYLEPELHDDINLEYSLQFKGNYLSSRLFYQRATNVINYLIMTKDYSSVESQANNLGTLSSTGLQLTGAFRIGIASFDPYLRVFNLNSFGNANAKQFSVADRSGLSYETGLSAIFSFRKDFALSFVFQYNSPVTQIIGNSFSDPLYFISFDKMFKRRIKIGIGTGLPFTKSFTYRGSEVNAGNLYIYDKGTVMLPSFPVWFRLGYQFNAGKTREKVNRAKEEFESMPKKGF